MRVKQYIVETMPEAMLQIRKDLGSDAVILSTKEIKVGGMMGMFRKKRIEVVAAVEEEDKKEAKKQIQNQVASVPRSYVPEAYRQTARSFVNEANESKSAAQIVEQYADEQRNETAAHAEKMNVDSDRGHGKFESSMDYKPRPEGADFSVSSSPAVQEPNKPGQQELMSELKELKKMMTQLSRQNELADPVPEEFLFLRERLINQEVRAEVFESWFETVQTQLDAKELDENEIVQSVQKQILTFLEERIDAGILSGTRIVYVAGPTGVGKTTTIAKLAAEQMFKHHRKVGFITSDTYRISAVEQLRTYASILNVPLEVVQSPGDTQRAISRLQDCDLIFMDTAGRNYRNELLVSELQSLLAPVENSETFLVLSMTSKSTDMFEITEHFSKYGLDKIIFTKMDETGTCGPMINLLHHFPLKLAYVTNGQNVPDDLLKPDPASLTKQLLGELAK
ncbi:flagellar biosynthesis protein FlhF [Paenibacillus illinoisensis]|uniref:Flagellar biosynthesis protein FlhF n=1 Tax=Paenibacillus illinoisensis TaxID=59845 RepID=A0A2W0CEJ2_9BACL|nr:flagellar biosynthesis protein FlhF [Paenibacillus illinoisensis]PYY26765.1 Signal recognition 54 kDa protein SRP54 [Paenibacillus illinoisensis]